MNPFHRCRTCLSEQNLHPMFVLPEYSEKYCNVLYLITGVKVKLNDPLPKEICATCITFINRSIKFRKKCKETQKILLENFALNFVNIKKSEADEEENSSSIDIGYPVEDLQCNDMENKVNVKVKTEVPVEYQSPIVKIEHQSDDEYQPQRKNNFKALDIEVEVPLEYNPYSGGSIRPAHEESGIKTEVVEIQVAPMDILPLHQENFIQLNKSGSTYKELLAEIKKAGLSRGRKHRCLYCNYNTTSREALNIHVRHHTGEKPYICDHCGASFHGRNNLIQHIAIHLPDKKFKCDMCPKFFKSRKFVLVHKHNVHTGKRYRYVCSVCKHTYEKPNKVRLHARRVHKMTAEEIGPIIRVEVKSINQQASYANNLVFPECSSSKYVKKEIVTD